MQIIYSKNFSLELPDDWGFEKTGSSYTFFSNNIGCILQVATYIKTRPIMRRDILDLISIEEEKHPLVKSKYGEFEEFSRSFIKEGDFWQNHWLRKEKLLLFITYINSSSKRNSVRGQFLKICNHTKVSKYIYLNNKLLFI